MVKQKDKDGEWNVSKKVYLLLIIFLSFNVLTGFSSSEYTRKVEPLPNMPEGNPDPSLGIVVHPNSTGVDVLRNSSQNIRFRGTKNYTETYIDQLSSSSMRDYTPKKFKFIDENNGFSSDNIFEFNMLFSYKNQEWKYIRFMPFPSVIEWVTEDELIEYMNQWVKTFDTAGWKRVEYPKTDDPRRIRHFTLPTPKYNHHHQYCAWTTKEYNAVITVSLRNREDYKYYIPKSERKNIKVSPDGYIAFIEITKNSQYE